MAKYEIDPSELVEEGVVDRDAAERIAAYAESTGAEAPASGIEASDVAYWVGGLTATLALGWFLNEAWTRYGGWALASLAAVYGAVFLAVGERLWQRSATTPGGLLLALAAWTAPLAAFGVQHGLGLWAGEGSRSVFAMVDVMEANRFVLEASLVAASGVLLRRRPFPFLLVPLLLGGWALGLDLAAVGTGGSVEALTASTARAVSIAYGALLLVLAYRLDRRTEVDYSFWLYLAGLLSLFGGLTAGGVDRVVYLAASLLVMAGAVLVRRRTPLVFGGLGTFLYLAWLAGDAFADSLLFPVFLTAAGIGLIGAGLLYRRHESEIVGFLEDRIPDSVRATLPPRRPL